MNMDASEVIALDEREQEEVIRVCRGAIAGRAPFLSGIVAGSTKAAAAKASRYAARGVDGFPIFPPFPTFSGSPVPEEMIYRYHKAIARPAASRSSASSSRRAGARLHAAILKRVAEIPGRRHQGILLRRGADALDHRNRRDAGAPHRRAHRQRHFIFEAMTMGCDGALIGFAGTFTRELVAMNERRQGGDSRGGARHLAAHRPIARYCWRPPIRDFRPRMKEVLRLQGHFPCAATREPQLGIDDAERAAIARLMREQELL